jgi:vanillate O-demethylase ferredoxin subunit
MSLTTRKVLLPLHLWGGLTLGLLLVVMAVSGALLVFRKQLEHRLDPALFVVQPGVTRLAPDDLVARARQAHPAAELESIRFYGDPTAPFLVYFSNKDYVHLNPYTGAVLGIRARYGEGFGWIEGLHKFLHLEPTTGEPITGYAALVFGLIILSGVVLWWPATRRALKAGLTLNPKLTGRPWNLNLHKTLGIYAAVVLLFTTFSGVPISLDWVRDSLYLLTGSKKVPAPVVAASQKAAPFAGFTAMTSRVAEVMPAARETYIPLPKKGVVSAYAIEADAGHPNARSYVWMEPATAEVLKTSPYKRAGTGFRLYYWMMSVHTGMLGGPVVQVILGLAALLVPVLAYTGTASYLRRKYGRPATAAAKTA